MRNPVRSGVAAAGGRDDAPYPFFFSSFVRSFSNVVGNYVLSVRLRRLRSQTTSRFVTNDVSTGRRRNSKKRKRREKRRGNKKAVINCAETTSPPSSSADEKPDGDEEPFPCAVRRCWSSPRGAAVDICGSSGSPSEAPSGPASVTHLYPWLHRGKCHRGKRRPESARKHLHRSSGTRLNSVSPETQKYAPLFCHAADVRKVRPA